MSFKFYNKINCMLFDKKESYSGSYGIHIARNIRTKYAVLLYLYVFQVWWQSDRNYDLYRQYKILNKSHSASMECI